ncbi:MAG: LPS export ABC transporter ATP-binding protein [Gemmatimonadetes bacterium]|nr:LPS export ABC transporter ATP-binding protein [Gemmatimonadota bacterium]
MEVRRGEVVGLLGPNGAGKTTTFYMVTGLVRADSGRVTIDGDDVTRLPMYVHARRGIGYLPQEASIFRGLTVRQNIQAILETTKLGRDERQKRLEQLLAELRIGHVADQKAFTLSGGERRRVEIARALVTQPSFLLLDEPFAGIDPIAVHDIQEIIEGLRRKGLGVLITDHNVRETLSITNRAYILFKGKVLISGTARELAENPEARAIYLGERFSL